MAQDRDPNEFSPIPPSTFLPREGSLVESQKSPTHSEDNSALVFPDSHRTPTGKVSTGLGLVSTPAPAYKPYNNRRRKDKVRKAAEGNETADAVDETSEPRSKRAKTAEDGPQEYSYDLGTRVVRPEEGFGFDPPGSPVFAPLPELPNWPQSPALNALLEDLSDVLPFNALANLPDFPDTGTENGHEFTGAKVPSHPEQFSLDEFFDFDAYYNEEIGGLPYESSKPTSCQQLPNGASPPLKRADANNKGKGKANTEQSTEPEVKVVAPKVPKLKVNAKSNAETLKGMTQPKAFTSSLTTATATPKTARRNTTAAQRPQTANTVAAVPSTPGQPTPTALAQATPARACSTWVGRTRATSTRAATTQATLTQTAPSQATIAQAPAAPTISTTQATQPAPERRRSKREGRGQWTTKRYGY